MAKDNSYYEAENKILSALRSGTRELDLHNMGLTELPDSVIQLTKLHELDLSKNKLKDFPVNLSQLKNLRSLKIESNQISLLPEYIGQLYNLEQLLMGDNQIKSLPEKIGNLIKLNEIDVAKNQLKDLPESFSRLINLNRLSLSHNRLKGNLFSELPEVIRKLKELNYLSVNYLNLRFLPDWIGELTGLSHIYLDHNQFTEIPITIGLLENLEVCDLDGNLITHLPSSVIDLDHLRVLSLNDNPLHNNLAEAYEQGIDSIKNYLRNGGSPKETKLIQTDQSNEKKIERKLKVFLCHASQDKSVVHYLYQRLIDEGWIEPWLDAKKLLPGQDWQSEIKNAVETADNVIIFLSNTSINKDGFIQKELRLAKDIALEKSEGSIFLIPLRLDECKVPRSLQFYQWANYFGEEQEQSYQMLLASLRLRLNDIEQKEMLTIKLQQQKFEGSFSTGIVVSSLQEVSQIIDTAKKNGNPVINLSKMGLEHLPESLEKQNQLVLLDLSMNYLTQLPDWFANMRSLNSINLSRNKISIIPNWINKLSELQYFIIQDNEISDLPNEIGELAKLKYISLDGNPLNPELAAAYKQGQENFKTYLSAKANSQIALYETKLIFVGEGNVGKSSLLNALCDIQWEENLSTTRGIEVKTIKVKDPSSGVVITLNGWDFGGQRVYRPTHQLFFSTPAIYIIVWEPRHGLQQGYVEDWIQLIRRRAPSAKILIVATHCNQRALHIDYQWLWDTYGKDSVFFVDSKPDEQGNRKGIEELKQAIAKVAAEMPEVGRSVPKSFADVWQALQERNAPYLSLQEVLDVCRAYNMDDEISKLFLAISHRLGHLTHYENDPTLRNIVILRPDWLATAISFVFDDENIRSSNGIATFRRLGEIWNHRTRSPSFRYSPELHPIFLRLMERFDLSYRIENSSTGDISQSISLIAQLVSSIRPENFEVAWTSTLGTGDFQQTQICHIVDAHNGESADVEGLFYQLIVRLHKYSLGHTDYKTSIHWQRGLVLEDEYKSRAFLEHIGNDIRITVRSPFPEGFLSTLTREVKYLVESFWEGLSCTIMVPCVNHKPCKGLIEIEKLIAAKKQGYTSFPCPVCNEWQNIDALLLNAPAITQQISIAELQSEFTAIKDKLDEVNVTSRRILSQVDKTYTDLLQILTDEAKEGPRLFSFFPVDRSNFNPKTWIREKFRLVLWCEHSRLPLPALNGADSKEGVYDLELDREWFKKSAPYLKFLTGTLGMVLPVASSAVKLALDEAAYKLIEEQLDFGKSVIDAAIGTSGNVNDFISKADVTDLEHGVASRADGSTLRELHALLKSKDSGFGGLVRVMNKRQEFLWVHERFASEY